VKTPRFEYDAPDTLDEALALLAEHGDECKVLAGGQSLVPLLAMRLARPGRLVDLGSIPDLDGIDDRGTYVAMGAMTRERAAERSSVVASKLPLLAAVLPHIGHVAIRNRGTVGGSIAHADASAELPLVAVATDAEMVVRDSKGERIVRAVDFFDGHFTTSMADDECLVEVRLPTSRADAGWGFHEVSRRHGDFAVVGVAAMVSLDDAGSIAECRLALMGVGDRAVRATDAEAAVRGASPTPEVFAEAAEAACRGLEPATDIHGSSEFRRHLAVVSVRRALEQATASLGGRQ
jgi:aerobic carbon-monoxide dehydrogenase medium subunit